MSDYKTLRLAFLLYWWGRKDNPTEPMRSVGLCHLFEVFIREQNLVVHYSNEFFAHINAFKAEFLSFPKKAFPFDADYESYVTDFQKHLNPHRRAWVEAQLKKLGLI